MTDRGTCEGRDWRGVRVTVMGLGLFGGGAGVARYLAERGARVLVTDLRSEEALRPSLEQLHDLPITFHLGEHCERDFTETELVVVNPAVKEDSPYLRAARESGVALETEINLFFRLCPAPILGVTGSVGKTTTTSMIGHILGCSGRRVHVGGNIGCSLLLNVEKIRPDDIVVVELSSFQLRRLSWTRRSPAISVVTNLHPNHLDNHPTLEEYAQCKKRILAYQRPGDTAVLNADDPLVSQWGEECRGSVLYFGLQDTGAPGAFARDRQIALRDAAGVHRVCACNEMPLPGVHNVANALAAAAACAAAGLSPQEIANGLRTVQPVPHRLEPVGEWGGVRYYNDSKATTPQSTLTALAAFDRPIILIAGGSSKGFKYGEFARRAVQYLKAAVLLGQTAPELAAAIRQADAVGRVTTRTASSLEEAVREASRLSTAGDVVLLSPTTASYDMFLNYEKRGECFKECVRRLGEPLPRP